MNFATGRYMRHGRFSHGYEVEDVVGMVRLVFGDRVRFHAGSAELAPGLSVHHIGGHTMGLQCVRVATARGWLVLASDCSHYYEHMETGRVFPTTFHVGDTVEGYDKLRALAELPEHIIPGHDPLVMKRYPAPSKALEGIAVRLDVPARDPGQRDRAGPEAARSRLRPPEDVRLAVFANAQQLSRRLRRQLDALFLAFVVGPGAAEIRVARDWITLFFCRYQPGPVHAVATLGVGEQPEAESPARARPPCRSPGGKATETTSFWQLPRGRPLEITAAFASQQLLSSGVAAALIMPDSDMFPGGLRRGAAGQNLMDLPEKQGLYDPRNEHDSCGVGFVADIKGRKSHAIVREGLSILVNLDHRGAVGADPLVGDGAGCLIQTPDALLRDWARKEGVDLPQPGHYAVAMCFLPQDEKARAFAIKRLEHFVKVEKQKLVGWRDVPTDLTGLGKAVIERMPVIKMAIVGRGPKLADQDAFERKILAIRKQTQNPLVDLEKKHKLPGLSQLYMPSFSSRTVVYKGLLLAPQVESFYEDLRNPLTQSALCLVHQRFSTNTFPSWKLAHPYRFIAHNGEINTVRGNVNWMYARRRTMESDLIGADLDKMWPIIPHGQSDTACVDNALELLVAGGYSLSHAMMMLIPEAWAGNPLMDAKRKAFYEYHAALMEPWDGPASIAFTDGRQIGATLDRNGLRPARFLVTDDDMVVMASEVGRAADPRREDRAQVAPAARQDAADRPRGGPHRRGRGAEAHARRGRALRGVAEGDAAQAGGAVGDARRAGARAVERSDHPARSPAGLRLHPGGHQLLPRADEQGARRSDRLDGHRHADRRALAASPSCSTTTSSRTSPRSPTRRSIRSARSW